MPSHAVESTLAPAKKQKLLESEDNRSKDIYKVHYNQQDALNEKIVKFESKQSKLNTSTCEGCRILHYDYSSINAPCSVKSRLLWDASSLSPLGSSLLSFVQGYNDLLFCNQSLENHSELRSIMAMHSLNHIMKAKETTYKHTLKLKQAQMEGKSLEFKDQGFTKPKVLVLLPFKNSCLQFVECLMTISGCTQIDNKKRFLTEFSDPENLVDESKPIDYQSLFSGNNDDHFRLGIKLNKSQMTLYSPFYSSDLLIASPLGLRTIIGGKGDKKRDYDFLSSIEIVILDQTDVFLMQNWDHVWTIMDHLNLIPVTNHDTDFSRVRQYFLEGNSRYLTQTLIFSHFLSAEVNALFNSRKNCVGKVKVNRACMGSAQDVTATLSQKLKRFNVLSIHSEPDERFKFFTQSILPKLTASSQNGILLFIPSYFDFVRLKKYFKEQEIEFVTLSEYDTNQDISRARGAFFHGNVSLLLMTERFYFFRRYKIRGSKTVVWYGLPEYDHFYPEILNCLEQPNESSSMALYCKYDQFKVERIMGSKNSEKLISGEQDHFMFS